MLKKRGLVTAGLSCCVSMLAWAQHTEASGHKVTICHKNDLAKYLQITVASRALPAHLAHGDCVVNDGVPCTVDRCDSELGCVHAPDNSLCGDGNACTIDVCDPSPVSAGCVYSAINCNDNDACTSDSCDPAAGCRNTDNLTCGACCLPDNSCVDRSTADECTAQGGEPQGAGTECATTQCCIPSGTGDCADAADCCDTNAFCNGNGTCCIPVGNTGCGGFSDCCRTTGATCESGKCCAHNGFPGSCTAATDCCSPNAICGGQSTCCIPMFRTGCSGDSDCCSGLVCTGGMCEGLIKP